MKRALDDAGGGDGLVIKKRPSSIDRENDETHPPIPSAEKNPAELLLSSSDAESTMTPSVSWSTSSSTTGTETTCWDKLGQVEQAFCMLEKDKDVIYDKAETNKSATSSARLEARTGIVYEEGTGHVDGLNRHHKERPARILSIVEALENEDSLLDRCHCLGTSSEVDAAAFLEEEDYLRVHLPGYMQRLKTFASCSCTQLDCEAAQYQSVFLTNQSTREAKRASASLCTLVSKVVQGELDNGFAIIRPPGHHAEPGLAGGYCLINNVAVAAAFARARLGVQKVLIVDWDIHHGNGTQSIFWNDPNVLYFSVHRWHGGNFYPFLKHGGPTAVGGGAGTGYNVNVGWTCKGMGDEEYFAIWERLLMPMAREFQPDLVLVSSGFDGAAGDMGECEISPNCFHLLTAALLSLANGRVVCALEGGYVRSVLQSCVKAVVRALLDPMSPQHYSQSEREALQERQGVDILETIESSAAKSIRATQAVHAPYWKFLC